MISWNRIAAGTAVFATVLFAGRVDAQYFGRNKVNYQTFNFEVSKTARFDIYFYPEEKDRAAQVSRMAERWHERLSRMLDHTLRNRQPILFYAAAPHFQQTNATLGGVGEGTGGFTEALKNRVVLPSAGPLSETDHVLGHELVHAFQYDMTRNTTNQFPGAMRLPLWFIEGMAEYLSLGPVDPQTALWMRDAVRSEDKPPRIKDLDNGKYFPYRWGHAFWAYVGGRFGDKVIGPILIRAGRTGDAVSAIEEVLEIKEPQLSTDWHQALRDTYGPYLETRRGEPGRLLIGGRREKATLNLAPALSPDGKTLAYISERDLLSIDIFLADAETGKVQRRLYSNATDQHISSIEFIDSAGGWSPKGGEFAFAAINKGHASLVLLDTKSGRRIKVLDFPDLAQAYDPTYSPDGRRIVFSAMIGGQLDLFQVEVATGHRRRLTEDPFAELQPSWSPDGRKVAFVTDRYSTRLDDLAFGNYQIAVLDLDSQNLQAISGFPGARHINPVWSADSRSLFFVSDRNGAPNVYRSEIETAALYQVTDLATGVSGITTLSPAMSIAAGGQRIAFSARDDGRYSIYTVEGTEKLKGTPVEPIATQEAAVLPPQERTAQVVENLRADAELGLPAEGMPASTPYKPKLGLDMVGSGGVGIGSDRYGAYFAGSVFLGFSDMLGDRNLWMQIAANGEIQDVGGQVVFFNLKRRANWQIGVEHIPLRYDQYASGLDPSSGAYVEQNEIFRQYNTAIFTQVAYPFSEGRRFELGVAGRRIGFGSETVTDFYDPYTGGFLGEDKQKGPAYDSIYLAETTAAFVGDTSVFGATGPIRGGRYRLEVNPNFGTINFTNLTFDVRHYFEPVRWYTLAFRALHFGRYGNGGNDERLQSISVGYPGLVRGYGSGTLGGGGFDNAECGANLATGECPVYDNLWGSRLLVGNVELRFPLLAPIRPSRPYGAIPIDIGVFADTGISWNSGDTLTWSDPPAALDATGVSTKRRRAAVSSVGFTGRLNFFGYAILEADYVKPLDRPDKGWVWQVNLVSGF